MENPHQIFSILTLIFCLIQPFSALAEDAKRNWAINFGQGNLLFRHSLANDNAFFFGGRLSFSQLEDDDFNQDFDSNTIGLTAGYRSYLDKDSINTFVDSSVDYTRFDADESDIVNAYGLRVLFGIETFLTDNISLEGSSGIAINYLDTPNYNETRLIIPVTNISLNYYF